MSCPDCAQAAQVMHHGFRAGCRGCCARAISRGINFHDSRKAGAQTRRYRWELEQFGVSHAEALAAFEADALNREPRQ